MSTDLEIVSQTLSNVDGVVTTTSRKIAKVFGKEHKDVLRVIRGLVCSEEFGQRNFTLTPYVDQQGKPYDEYVITRDGATFLISRFTGEIAARWMESYIAAFNQMEKTLLKLAPSPQTPIMLPVQQAEVTISSFMSVGRMFGLPDHMGAIEGVKEAKTVTGIDFEPLLKNAPFMVGITKEEEYLEPTELGKRYDISGAEVNRILAIMGCQYKDPAGWVVCPGYESKCSKHAWKRGAKSGYNLKWNVSFVDDVMNRYAAE